MDGMNTVFGGLRLPFTMLFTGLGVWGAIEHAKRDKASFVFMLTLFATVSAALIFYLNFKYGYTLRAPTQDRGLHEVRERDYFFLVSFSVWGLWAGMGIATLWREAAGELKTTMAKASPILALAFIPLVFNWGWASRSQDYAARDWAYNLLMSVEPYAVLFTNGDNDTFPLWYLQEVEGIRQDVTVIVGSYLNTDWYAMQLKRLTTPCEPGQDPSDDPTLIICQRPYTAENTPSAYVGSAGEAGDKTPIVLGRPITPPTKSIIPLTDEQIVDATINYPTIREEMRIPLGNLVATIAGGQYLPPWKQFALNILNQSLDERPIYFASSGNNASELGLDPYLIREGLAFRVNNGPPSQQGPGIVRLDQSPFTPVTGDFLNVERTRELFEQVFIHRTGLPDEWDHWPDLATVGIPSYYAWGYLALAQAAVQDEDREALDYYQARAEAWSRLGLSLGLPEDEAPVARPRPGEQPPAGRLHRPRELHEDPEAGVGDPKGPPSPRLLQQGRPLALVAPQAEQPSHRLGEPPEAPDQRHELLPLPPVELEPVRRVEADPVRGRPRVHDLAAVVQVDQIERHRPAAGPQHARDLGDRGLLLRRLQMLDHGDARHHVEARVGEVDRGGGHPAVVDGGARRAAGGLQHPLRRVDAHRQRAALGEPTRPAPESTPDVERARPVEPSVREGTHDRAPLQAREEAVQPDRSPRIADGGQRIVGGIGARDAVPVRLELRIPTAWGIGRRHRLV